ncbi:MAG: NifU N-terminal domain-containing protein [Actinomycetota bacterium]|nr:NifU N-terminal domain-containing protein [Actinomycetota bacterium]
MATAEPAPSPNPNALRFQLDVTLPDTLSANGAGEAAGSPFLEAVFAAPGVATVFGVNDFVTVTRTAGAEWEPIVAAVQAAAAAHL